MVHLIVKTVIHYVNIALEVLQKTVTTVLMGIIMKEFNVNNVTLKLTVKLVQKTIIYVHLAKMGFY